MTETEAYEVAMLIRASTGGRVESSTFDYFQVALLPLDYTLGLSAATIGTITWRKFPSWAEFKEIYRAQERLNRPPEPPLGGVQTSSKRGSLPESEENPEFKRGERVADWVHVYYWCRVMRQPTTMESFPQQKGHVDPTSVMSMERYEELRKEWEEAGAPKYEKPIPMAR